MADVKISQLHKHYGNSHAVKGVDLTIPDGEFTVLVGPSGCGKSTLLRTIAGLEDAEAGTIEIGGQIVNNVRPRDRDIAMVFQNYALYPFLSVYENIAFGLRARKTPEPELKSRVGRAAEMLAITHLLDRLPRQLSGGQRRRVAIGRAIVRNPKVFLFDEPLSNLDAQLRDEMRGEIKRLHQDLGTTMIYVTHDQIEAMTLADRIVLMRDAVIEQQGTPLELLERLRTKFVARFLATEISIWCSSRAAYPDKPPLWRHSLSVFAARFAEAFQTMLAHRSRASHPLAQDDVWLQQLHDDGCTILAEVPDAAQRRSRPSAPRAQN